MAQNQLPIFINPQSIIDFHKNRYDIFNFSTRHWILSLGSIASIVYLVMAFFSLGFSFAHHIVLFTAFFLGMYIKQRNFEGTKPSLFIKKSAIIQTIVGTLLVLLSFHTFATFIGYVLLGYVFKSFTLRDFNAKIEEYISGEQTILRKELMFSNGIHFIYNPPPKEEKVEAPKFDIKEYTDNRIKELSDSGELGKVSIDVPNPDDVISEKAEVSTLNLEKEKEIAKQKRLAELEAKKKSLLNKEP